MGKQRLGALHKSLNHHGSSMVRNPRSDTSVSIEQLDTDLLQYKIKPVSNTMDWVSKPPCAYPRSCLSRALVNGVCEAAPQQASKGPDSP